MNKLGASFNRMLPALSRSETDYREDAQMAQSNSTFALPALFWGGC